jgi:hypothetical protein
LDYCVFLCGWGTGLTCKYSNMWYKSRVWVNTFLSNESQKTVPFDKIFGGNTHEILMEFYRGSIRKKLKCIPKKWPHYFVKDLPE